MKARAGGDYRSCQIFLWRQPLTRFHCRRDAARAAFSGPSRTRGMFVVFRLPKDDTNRLHYINGVIVCPSTTSQMLYGLLYINYTRFIARLP